MNQSNKSLNSTMTRIKQLSTGPPIEVVPSEIIFKDIQINQTYEITVFVRNLTQTARRIRVFQPHSNFRCDYEMQGAIAAGLSMKLIVTFETASLEQYQDSLKIVSDGNYTIDVPLFAFPPQAAIVFEPFINLGFVRVGKDKVDYIYFKNEGRSTGKVELKIDHLPDFKIEPTSFSLQAAQEYSVKVSYKPKDAGIFRGLVEVIADGQSLQKTIDINATSIEFTRFLIDDTGVQNNFFDFGQIYYGQFKQIETYLVNNTPKQQKFKVKLKKGLHQQEDALKLQTPAELGLEQTERIMECFPEEGVLESYSQVAIVFKCKPKVSEEQQVWTRSFALTPDQLKPDYDEFHYSAIFDFQDNEPLMNHLQVRCICPTIKFPPTAILQFGICPANQNKEIVFEVANKQAELPIQIHWPVVPYFSVNPPMSTLQPEEKQNFWVSFKPKHTGNFTTVISAELLGGIFKIPVRLAGVSQQFTNKQQVKRGPESLPEDFEMKHTITKEQSISNIKSIEKVQTLDISQSVQSLVQQGISLDKIEELKQKSLNKEIYNEYLKMHREQRLKKVKDKKIKQKFTQMNERLKEIKQEPIKPSGATKKQEQDEEQKPEPPIDYEFAVGMQDDGYEQELPLPEANETLFVTKPIFHYEPLIQNQLKEGKQLKPFEPDLRNIQKKKFPFEPKTHSEIRDTSAELNADQLQKIQAGPVKIEFGNVFIKSTVLKFFYVRNDLRNSISVRLHTDKEDFNQSYIKPQIIPSGQTAQFDVVLFSKQLGQIKTHLKYVINENHIFEFLVQANIERVFLEMNRTQIKFAFNEDNNEMETTEIVRLTNNGNAEAKYRWITTEKKIFYVQPESGVVPSGKYLECQVIYKPSQFQPLPEVKQPIGTQQQPDKNTQGQQQQQTQQQQQQQQQSIIPQQQATIATIRNEEEKLTLKTEDGLDQNIKCMGIVSEPKCTIKQAVIDFKEIVVCKQETKVLTIKNLSKSSAVFQVQTSKLPEGIEVYPIKGKISSEDSRDLQVKFLSKEERIIKGEIIILIRGGKQLQVPVTGSAIIPKIEILEEEFDFGNITTLGTSNQLSMTLVNNSTIPVDLVLDLRHQNENPRAPDGIDCLEVKPQDEDDTILHSIHPENEDEPAPKLDESLDNQSDKSEQIDLETKEYRSYNLTILPGKTQVFLMKFSPKDVKHYQFDMPITLARFNQNLPSLTRRVSCKGLKPKFLVEPQSIEFKKKIITSPDKCYPTVEEIKLSNPDRKDVKWRIDTTPLKIEKIFTIEPSEGIVGSGQQVRIRVKFNPYGPGVFQSTVSLYIESDPDIPKTLPYVDLLIQGSGAYPRLLFDKKEVILPVVPLNVVSKCSFKIINDGYENLNLKHNWSSETSNFYLELKFPEGQTLGVAKSKLRVDVYFSHKKPISFTTRAEFQDEGRVYSIYVSGTTDNCLLTNQIYLQRIQKYQIIAEEKKPVMFQEDDGVDSDNEKMKRNHTMSVKSTTSSKGTSHLGYRPLDAETQNEACDYIMRWMNYHVLTQPINKFPEDIVTNFGQQIFELLTFLTGKANFQYKAQVDQNWKRQQKAEAQFKQYDELVRQLKIEGALLNHIRSEYLLGHNDYNAWLKTVPKEKYEFVPDNRLQLSLAKYNYLHYDAWVSTFYQIIKIYYLNRITAKSFKQLPGIPTERLNIPDYYLDGSNVISHAEGVILWFYEICYEQQHTGQIRRVSNFASEFRDSLLIADAVTQFIGPSMQKFFSNLKTNLQSDDDYRNNADKLMPALSDYGLQSHVQAKDIYYKPHPREMLMMLVQLFFSLPHYVPQKEPIIFQCILGEEVIKSIELRNPTQKPISYFVKYEGHPDFQLEGDESIKIEPDIPYNYKVKFTSRISLPVTGRVIFTNKKETNVQAAALVFDLKSNITGRKSEKQWNVSSILYEIFDFQIQITNKFPQDGEFQIQITHEKKQIEQRGKKKKAPLAKDAPPEEEFPSFFCTVDRQRIRKNQTINLSLTYIPLAIDTHKCSLIFTDPNVGEFQHDLQGTVELPNIISEFKPDKQLYVDSVQTISYMIPFRNEQLARARSQIQQLVQMKQKDRYLKGDKQASTLTASKLNFPGSNLDIITFEVEIYPATQYLNLPPTLQITDLNKQMKKPGTENIDCKLPIQYAFKNATKDFNVILTLRNKFDIRRYKLSAIVLPKIVKAMLEFRVPARQSVIQEIPIVNQTDRDWQIKVQLSDSKGLFQCPQRDFFVKRKSPSNFPITFSPSWLQECEAKLVLTNPITNDVFEYELKGYGEEPVAEEHIILNCQARKITKKEIELKNPTDKAITYAVETDLIYATGPQQIVVQPQKKATYVLQVQPVLSGQYTGSITFTDEQGHYLWYTVFMNTESPKSVQTLEVSCLIRQATVIQLTLANPLTDTAIYEVMINGEGLIGEEQFAIGARKEAGYELTFAPLKIGRWRGSVAFVNRLLGEVWYEFILTCEDQPIVRLNVLKASLGKVEQQVVVLENPSDQKIQVQCRITNPTNFDIYPDELQIQAYDSLKVALRYTPSSLDIIEQSDIIFTSPIGKWHYLVFGSGLPPTKFPATTVSIGLNKDYSSVIHFKNPFKEPIQVSISLDAEGHNQEVFKLLLVRNQKNDKTLVPGMNVLQVPFSFVPREITSYYCEVVISMNEKIQWHFPVKGVTESVSTQTLFHFKAKCREKWEDEIKVGLQGIAQSLQADDKFDYELGGMPLDLQTMIQKCFTIKCLKNHLDSPHDNLLYFVRFQPMKPFKTSMEFIVLRQSGGRWKYKIQLEATEPEEDDTILISSPLNKTTSVSFKLTNKTKNYSKFTAAFSPESDAEFSVIPKLGDLEPYGREGTTFIISFTPVEYGKIRKGKLIIQTEDMYWSYSIRGVLPRYVPPQIKQSLVDNKQQQSQIQMSMTLSRNFVVDNIKKARQLSPKSARNQLSLPLIDKK